MKHLIALAIALCGCLTATAGWTTPPQPEGLYQLDTAVANWFKAWESRVNQLSSRVDQGATGSRQQAALQGFFVADTVQVPDLSQPALLYQHLTPHTTAGNWIGTLPGRFWEDVFVFRVNPYQLRVVDRKRNRVRLEVTAKVALTGVFRDSRQQHHLQDDWVFLVEANAHQKTYTQPLIRSIRRSNLPVELPGLTVARVAGYHDQLQHWLVRFLADSSGRDEAHTRLRQLMRSDTILIATNRAIDTLTLDELPALRLRPEALAYFRVQSFDMSYCDEYLPNPDRVLVGRQITLEGITLSIGSQQLYQRRHTDAVRFPEHQTGPWAQVSNVIINWTQPEKTR
ncbi:hypothetical protein GCM10023187_32200 [Nibrella viscosa]|uniref:Uncharacterized protein n=1 Tax=Nibrella viscosa TaxID=1084524 RepID=A0ABP8KM90_9BACT